MSVVYAPVALGELLIRSSRSAEIDPLARYQEVTVRMWGRRSARAVFYALQFFFPNLSYSRRFLPRNRHEIDRPGSTDRDGRRHIDVAPDRIRVRADGMSTLDEPFSGLSVDASHGHGKRGG
jgi:hypothetical protein